MPETIYLDYAATAPVRPDVIEAMAPYWRDISGNASSLHAVGRAANKAMAVALEAIAQSLGGVLSDDILVTSGATESNNLALKGLAFGLAHKGKHIVTTAIEHPAVLEPCRWLETQGYSITVLPVDANGFVSPEALSEAITPETILVSVMHGNNEVGTLQPIAALAGLARERGVLFHTDAVQTVGKLPLDLTTLSVDLLSCSAHKLGGPKGIGFLYANSRAREALVPLLHGGGQQSGFRSGTENLPLLVGMAYALTESVRQQLIETPRLRQLQEKLIAGILQLAPGIILNGPRNVEYRVPGNVNFSFPPIEGEALVLRFDLAGVAVSSGSACHQAELTGSDVLRAMGVNANRAKSSIRFSMGYDTTEAQVDALLALIPGVLDRAGFFKLSA